MVTHPTLARTGQTILSPGSNCGAVVSLVGRSLTSDLNKAIRTRHIEGVRTKTLVSQGANCMHAGFTDRAVRFPTCLTDTSAISSAILRDGSFRLISERGSNGVLACACSTSAKSNRRNDREVGELNALHS